MPFLSLKNKVKMKKDRKTAGNNFSGKKLTEEKSLMRKESSDAHSAVKDHTDAESGNNIERADKSDSFAFCCLISFLTIISAVISFFTCVFYGTVMLASTCFITFLVRIIMREKSPWKIRSVFFDSSISLILCVSLVVILCSSDMSDIFQSV